jgi:hypothetical protein
MKDFKLSKLGLIVAVSATFAGMLSIHSQVLSQMWATTSLNNLFTLLIR